MLIDKIPVGMGTLLLEKKIIHNLGIVGHIEDIIIDKKRQLYHTYNLHR